MSVQNLTKLENSLKTHDWSDIITCRDVNKKFQNFTETFMEYFNRCCPEKEMKTLKKDCFRPWLTIDLINKCETKNKLYNKFLLKKTAVCEQEYKYFRNKVNRELKRAKQNYYDSKLSNNAGNPKEYWRILNSISNDKATDNLIGIIDHDELVTDPIQIANVINDFFIECPQQLSEKITSSESGNTAVNFENRARASLFLNPATGQEIERIIKDIKNSNSAGFDNMSNHIMKIIFPAIKEILVHLYNETFSSGIFPDILKIGKIIPVFKTGDKLSPSNYRPISLLPVIGKVLERLYFNRLYSFLNENELLFTSQYGFRAGRTTTHAILEVQNYICEAKALGKRVAAIMLDLKKAFDTVNHQILLKKLSCYGIRGIPLTWIKNYLSNREQFVTIKDKAGQYVVSQMKEVKIGVPQGSVLGSILFSLYINDIDTSSPEAKIVLFADDTVMLFSSEGSLEDFNNKITRGLLGVGRWLLLNKLTLNVQKTTAISFHNNEKLNLSLNNEEIRQVETAKYLGIIISKNLKWSEHIKLLADKMVSDKKEHCGNGITPSFIAI